ncbi:hypothetical protein ACHAPF_002265 [Botrytis cinerea]
MADLVPYTVLLYGLKRTGREFPLYTFLHYARNVELNSRVAIIISNAKTVPEQATGSENLLQRIEDGL